MYYDDDADLSLLDGKTVAILGYGSQGHAHSLNLKDSGVDVVVGLREGSASVEKARAAGLEVTGIADAASRGDIVMVLLPDEKHGQVYRDEIADGVAPGNLLLFGHGFSIHFGEIEPPPEVDVGLVAPKGPGHLVRRQYVEARGVPGLIAIQQDATGNAKPLTLAYARGIGCTRAGVIETTFKDETETDLFGEQAVLCGGVSELVKAGYETLVDAGYDPKLAYFECLHELKLIVDLMYEKGLTGMRYSISNTAEYGDYTRGKRIIGAETRQAMKDILGEIQSGEFAREWIAENRAGPGELPAHARGGGRPPGRARGQAAALDDGLDRDRVLGPHGTQHQPASPGTPRPWSERLAAAVEGGNATIGPWPTRPRCPEAGCRRAHRRPPQRSPTSRRGAAEPQPPPVFVSERGRAGHQRAGDRRASSARSRASACSCSRSGCRSSSRCRSASPGWICAARLRADVSPASARPAWCWRSSPWR